MEVAGNWINPSREIEKVAEAAVDFYWQIEVLDFDYLLFINLIWFFSTLNYEFIASNPILTSSHRLRTVMLKLLPPQFTTNEHTTKHTLKIIQLIDLW